MASARRLFFFYFSRHLLLISVTFETFGKKLADTKIVARVNVKTIKKTIEKRLLNRLRRSSNGFLPNLSIMVKADGFLAAAEVLLKCYK